MFIKNMPKPSQEGYWEDLRKGLPVPPKNIKFHK